MTPRVITECEQGEIWKMGLSTSGHPWAPNTSWMQNKKCRRYKKEAGSGGWPRFGLEAPRSAGQADRKVGLGQCRPKLLQVRTPMCRPPVTNSHFLSSFKNVPHILIIESWKRERSIWDKNVTHMPPPREVFCGQMRGFLCSFRHDGIHSAETFKL